MIYDGAFSEHLTNPERKGLTGEEIDENKAKDIATQFIGKDKIKRNKFKWKFRKLKYTFV